MKLFVTVLLVAASASAASLENTYLPPTNAKLSGGSDQVLVAPTAALSTPASTTISHVTPIISSVPAPAVAATRFIVPSVSYGVPIGAVKTYLTPVTPPVPIVRISSESNSYDRSYRYDYETANHIAAQESGRLNAAGSTEVQGAFSYLAPNGETISVRYVADENGFRPEGSHLPTPPPIPEAILKSLELNAAEEARAAAKHIQYGSAGVEVAAVRQVAVPAVGTQYLPPLVGTTQVGYRY